MENRISCYKSDVYDYIQFEDDTNPLNHLNREELIEYHYHMIAFFQHERLIHLIVTLFFAATALAAITAVIFVLLNVPAASLLYFIPLYLLAIILSVLTGFYIKHYYFLENNIQELYDLTEVLYQFL